MSGLHRALIVSAAWASAWRCITVGENGDPGTEDAPAAGLTLRDHYSHNRHAEQLMRAGNLAVVSADPDGLEPCRIGGPFVCVTSDFAAVVARAHELGCSWLYLWTGAQWLSSRLSPGSSGLPLVPVVPFVDPSPL